MIFILAIVFIIYACLDAVTQAYYYKSNPSDDNIHYLYLIQRAIVVCSLSFNIPAHYELTSVGIFAFSLCLIYSFFHNGVYYLARGKKVYPKGFWSNSNGSTAVMEFGIIFRTIMAVIGLIFIYGLTL